MFSPLRHHAAARRLRAAVAAVAIGHALVSGGAPAQAQLEQRMADDPVAIFNAAIQAFERGEWTAAISGLEKVLSTVNDPEQQKRVGPAYFTLASACFNAGDYAKAAEKFSFYLKNYPQGDKAPDARLGLARAHFLGKDYAQAAPLFAQIESIPAYRDMALAAQAVCYKERGNPEEQARVREKMVASYIKTDVHASGAVMLAQLYLEQGQFDKALRLVNQLHARVALVDNVVMLNALTVKLGDELAETKHWAQALAAYRAVRSRDEVIAFQKDRLAAMERRMHSNAERGRGDAQAALATTGANRQIEAERDHAARLLEAFEKLPDHQPGVLFRMARVWYDQNKKWEASVVFDEYLARYPQDQNAEQAMYSMIVCFADLGRAARTQKLCERYLEMFPKGKNADAVGYLLGATSLQAHDPKKAVSFFGAILAKQPGSQFAQQMRMGLGNARFMMGEFAAARKDYQTYLTKFPGGQFAEEAQYREALATLSLGEYEKALEMLGGYLQKFPQGAFIADAGYRVMVCKYAGSLYDEVIADAKAWQQKHAGDAMTGEVCALLGDAFAAADRREDAVAAYTKSYKAAQTDEVFNYALFEASKQLQKLGKWDEVSRMFEEFVREKPEHPTVVAAMFWIGRAKAREGKTEEAKTFLVTQIKRYLNEPKREAVEQLLQQLAQLCSKRPRPPKPAGPPPAPTVAARPAGGAPTPAATPVPAPPPPPPYDAVAELRKLLAPLEADANLTGRARLLYAEAELAKLRKQPAEVQRIYTEIAGRFKPADLSPVLLALVGEHLLAKGEGAKARAIFESMRADYPKSDYIDYAYVGLGQLAFDERKYPKALELFTYAADEIAASRVKDATVGKARALLELGRFDESRKLFEQVASVREWRGESTAEAVYSLGEIETRQGRLAEGIAHYQRVFVAYQKYLSWAAKAYLRAAETFDKMGRRKEATGHLQEMLRNEKLEKFPEATQAKKLLSQWGGPA